ncbi:hypothetical protein ACWDTP_37515 [Mycobacterium sp. NPDC003449]
MLKARSTLVAGVAAIAAMLALGGCEQVVTGTALKDPNARATVMTSTAPTSAAADAGPAEGCADVAVDNWAEVSPAAPGEPTVRVPQPTNWVPVPELAQPPIKFIMRNPALVVAGTVPVVSLSVGDATDGRKTPQDLLDDSFTGFKMGGAQNITSHNATVCGFPGRMIDYFTRAPDGTQITVRAVSVMIPVGARIMNVVATVQSAHPDDPTYQRDSELVISGLTITAPR